MCPLESGVHNLELVAETTSGMDLYTSTDGIKCTVKAETSGSKTYLGNGL